MATLLTTAIKTDDLDAAIAPLQLALGIKSGDVAGQFFSGFDIQHWKALDATGRAELLGEYLAFECEYAVD